MINTWLYHKRGETISFGLKATPAYLGTEQVTCDVKVFCANGELPKESDPVHYSVTPVFIPAEDDDPAIWSFFIPDDVTATWPEGQYVTDARIEDENSVYYPDPLGIMIEGRVTV